MAPKMKMNATETCSGCGVKFSPSGLSHHVSQTKKPACVAIQQTHPELSGGLTPQFTNLDFDAPPVQFQGDYYGDYVDEDFDNLDQTPSPSEPHSLSGSESSDEDSGEVEQAIWEPPAQPVQQSTPSTHASSLNSPAIPTAAQCEAAEREARRQTFVVHFKATAGAAALIPTDELDVRRTAPTSSYKMYTKQVGDGAEDNPYYPFTTHMEWEVAHWAKLRGSGSTAFSDLLAIEGVRIPFCFLLMPFLLIFTMAKVAEALHLSFKNSHKLNTIINKLPLAQPQFKRYKIIVAGESFEVYFQDILECIRLLYGDLEFAPLLLLVPEKHYTDGTCQVCVYFDMNTGKWWWVTQVSY